MALGTKQEDEEEECMQQQQQQQQQKSRVLVGAKERSRQLHQDP
jgi:hypothetical protein